MNKKIVKEIDCGQSEPELGIDKERFGFAHRPEPAEGLKKFLSVECPRCEGHKLEEETAGESRFKQCPHCGGAWFNINELERALGRGIKFSLPACDISLETLAGSPRLSESGAGSPKPVCPLCHTGLIQIKAMDTSGLTVHACLICQGRWVDGSEIVRQQQKGLFAHIRELVMRLF
ncbi:MAG: zf-TFIIB domain-containing protein [Planctomycetota bacterium]